MATRTVTAGEGIGANSRAILEPLYPIGLAPHDGFASGTVTITFVGGYITQILYTNTLDLGSSAWNPPSAAMS